MRKTGSSSPRTRVIATILDGSVPAAVRALEARGMHVRQVHDLIRSVAGDVDPERLAELKGVPGVAIEVDHDVQLPPPGSAVQ